MRKMRFILKLLLILLIPCTLLVIMDNYFSERTSLYVNKQIQTHVSIIIANIINQEIIPEYANDELLMIKYSDDKRINSIIINTKITNQILSEINDEILTYLSPDTLNATFGSVEIPLGILISKTILASFGPKIRIPIKPLGTYQADIKSNVTSYGINNSLIEVYLELNIDLEAFLPLVKRSIDTKTKILLASQIVQGEVPRYYGMGKFAIYDNDVI